MAQASRALVRAGVFADVVDVGGGFPSVYPGMVPPDLADYIAAIDRGFAEMMVHETTELWCEPGRALVAEGLLAADPGRAAQGRRPLSERRLLWLAVRRRPLQVAVPGQAGPRRRRADRRR